ncbi:Uncharacterised protein [Mycobacteroides abscessus subsp. abscessus]|nr:Uncharacterised protein [Mycobacteroides abscessus subsp. abscessus]
MGAGLTHGLRGQLQPPLGLVQGVQDRLHRADGEPSGQLADPRAGALQPGALLLDAAPGRGDRLGGGVLQSAQPGELLLLGRQARLGGAAPADDLGEPGALLLLCVGDVVVQLLLQLEAAGQALPGLGEGGLEGSHSLVAVLGAGELQLLGAAGDGVVRGHQQGPGLGAQLREVHRVQRIRGGSARDPGGTGGTRGLRRRAGGAGARSVGAPTPPPPRPHTHGPRAAGGQQPAAADQSLAAAAPAAGGARGLRGFAHPVHRGFGGTRPVGVAQLREDPILVDPLLLLLGDRARGAGLELGLAGLGGDDQHGVGGAEVVQLGEAAHPGIGTGGVGELIHRDDVEGQVLVLGQPVDR